MVDELEKLSKQLKESLEAEMKQVCLLSKRSSLPSACSATDSGLQAKHIRSF